MQQMLTAMNATSLGPDMLGDTSGPMFKSMFSQQIATSISQGQGIGLASFIARELSVRYGVAPGAAQAQSAIPSGASGAATATPFTPGERAETLSTAILPMASTRSTAAALPRLDGKTPVTVAASALPAVQTPAAQPKPAQSSASSADAVAQAKEFIASILPSVQTAAQQLGVTPVAILAQAALETGWGRHTPGNNLFGVKAGGGWTGATVQTLTREIQGGVASVGNAAFRAYQNVADSVQSYAALLSRPRYQSARDQGDDIPAFASALQRSGYATDPDYAAKLVAIARSPRMQQALDQLGLGSSFSAR
jgi:flagellar protein FlgJ